MEEKIITQNRSATHEYIILEKIEAGIVLDGAEVKSIRLGNTNLKDSFCHIYQGEIIVKNMHVAVYDKAGAFNTKNAKRDRKLLLHKSEIAKLIGKVSQKGLTIVPLKLYFKGSLIKMEIGLCQGKHIYDKKQSLKEKDIKRLLERDIKNYR
jgi:SsrA-binding protein